MRTFQLFLKEIHFVPFLTRSQNGKNKGSFSERQRLILWLNSFLSTLVKRVLKSKVLFNFQINFWGEAKNEICSINKSLVWFSDLRLLKIRFDHNNKIFNSDHIIYWVYSSFRNLLGLKERGFLKKDFLDQISLSKMSLPEQGRSENWIFVVIEKLNFKKVIR